MRSALLVFAGIGLWAGATLLLAEGRWFAQGSLAERLSPHVRAHRGIRRREGVFSLGALRDLLGPSLAAAGAVLARGVGVDDDLATVLRRLDSDDEVVDVRLRELRWSGAAALAAAGLASALPIPAPVQLAVPVLAALAAFLVTEQRLMKRSSAIQRRLRLELPVVIEQLGTLLSAGSSLPGALAHIAHRASGIAAAGFRHVTRRAAQGVDELAALREWAEVMRVPALDRFVGVLALHREARDLGALISNEARLTRAEVHRELVEELDRRAQAVWIPVTVATLLPGVIFMAVPFVDALHQLGAT